MRDIAVRAVAVSLIMMSSREAFKPLFGVFHPYPGNNGVGVGTWIRVERVFIFTRKHSLFRYESVTISPAYGHF